MSADAPLEAEARDRRWAVPAAALAGLLPFAAACAGLVVIADSPSNRPSGVLFLDDNAVVLDLISAVLAVGALALGATLVYLFRATKARRPELRQAFLVLAVIGSLGYALVGTLGQVLQGIPPFGLLFQILTGARAHQFATEGGQTYQEARDLFSSGLFAAGSLLQALTTFALAAAIIVIALNAIRVGLLPRVFGYIGVLAGVLLVLPLGTPVPVVQSFWLFALAILFSGRWPSGLPPAWRTGRAEPWPTLQQQRERAAEARDASPDPVAATPASSGPTPADPGAARRKRKRRR